MRHHPARRALPLHPRTAPQRAPSPPSSSSSASSDESSDGTENSDGEYVEKEKYYRFGGYHRVAVGDVLAGRYRVTARAGFGHFSTVWLARDEAAGADVAVKVVKSARVYADAARDEAAFLAALARSDAARRQPVLHLLDAFSVDGPNGTHPCIVTEAAGSSVLALLDAHDGRGVPAPAARRVAAQLLEALAFVHGACGLIHTDVKPENVLLSFRVAGRAIPPDFAVRLADFGNACFTTRRFTDDIQTVEYRAPEVILGAHWGFPVDVWSAACLLFELLTGDYLFRPRRGRTYSTADDHLAQFVELLGPLPARLLRAPRAARFFTRAGELRNIPAAKLHPWRTADVLEEKYGFERGEAACVAELLEGMLVYDETKRWSEARCLAHTWFK